MDDLQVVVGLTGVGKLNMPGNDRELYQKIIEEMKGLEEKLNFKLIYIDKPLELEEDGRRAREYFEERKVDFTMIFNASLGFWSSNFASS